MRNARSVFILTKLTIQTERFEINDRGNTDRGQLEASGATTPAQPGFIAQNSRDGEEFGCATQTAPLSAVDYAALHDEIHFLENVNVVERIAGDGDDIGEIAGLECAYLILPAEQFCAVEKVRLQRGERRHSVFHHEIEFASLRAVREWADIGANSHRYACGELFAKFLAVKVEQLVAALDGSGIGGVVSKIFGDGEGGDGEDLFFAHDAHGLVAKLIGVVD